MLDVILGDAVCGALVGSDEEAGSGSDNDEAEKRQRARKRLRMESQVRI